MLLEQTVKLVIKKGRMLKFYREKGIDCNQGDTIEIPITLLPKGSHVKVLYKCDYCGAIGEKSYDKYNLERQIVEKDCCKKCQQEKKEEALLKKYGERFPLKNKEIKKKMEQTNLKKYGNSNPIKNQKVLEKRNKTNQERYGGDSPFSSSNVREKAEKTVLEKYGVRNVFCKGEIREKSYAKTLITKYNNKNVPCSKVQLYLSHLFQGECNKLLCDYFFVDIFFEDLNIYCEYDGGGHNLNVKLGQISEKEFNKKQNIRYQILKKNGYKCFRIINTLSREKIPSDEILNKIKKIAFDVLQEENIYYIYFDLDRMVIGTKYKEIKFNYENIFNINKNMFILEQTQIGEP